MVAENLFGDVLTDEPSMLAPWLGEGGIGSYEPVHGSAATWEVTDAVLARLAGSPAASERQVSPPARG